MGDGKDIGKMSAQKEISVSNQVEKLWYKS